MKTPFESEKFPAKEYDLIKAAGNLGLQEEGIPTPKLNLVEYSLQRRAFDLTFVLPLDLRKAIKSNLLDPIRDFFEGRLGTEQIIATEGSLHTTLFQILPSDSEPNYNPEDPTEKYIEIARSVLTDLPPVEISFERFLRFPGSPGGLMLGGIPSDNGINWARARLKTDIAQAGLRQHRPRDVKIAHISLMRDFTRVGRDRAGEIIDFVQQRDKSVYWGGRLERVNLQTGDYFMDPKTVKVIEGFNLVP